MFDLYQFFYKQQGKYSKYIIIVVQKRIKMFYCVTSLGPGGCIGFVPTATSPCYNYSPLHVPTWKPFVIFLSELRPEICIKLTETFKATRVASWITKKQKRHDGKF